MSQDSQVEPAGAVAAGPDALDPSAPADRSAVSRRRALTGLGAAAAVGVTATLLNPSVAEATSPASAARFYAYGPTRLIDTRTEGGRMTRAQSRLQVWLDTTNNLYAGLLANVTVVNTTKAGYLTFYSASASRPNVSDLNWWASGITLSNAVYIPLGSGGGSAASFRYYLFGDSGVSADVIVDVKGFYYNG